MDQRLVRAFLAAGLCLVGGLAMAEDLVPPLYGTVDDVSGVTALRQTSLDITPLVTVAPPRRRASTASTYDAPGIRVGAFVLHPQATFGAVYTSNVRQVPGGGGDLGLTFRPSLSLESDWVRHGLTASASGSFTHYLENGSLDASAADLAADLRLDVRHDTTADLTASYVLTSTGQGSSEVPATAIGLARDHAIDGGVAVTHDFGTLTARLAGGVGVRLFDDVALSGGGHEDNSDRDYVAPSLSLRVAYVDPPALKPFVEAGYTPRFYTRTFDRNGVRRSSQGYRAAVGALIDRGPLWSGEVALTYDYRDYDDAALRDGGVAGLNGQLTWSPGALNRIVFGFGTSLDDTFSAGSGLGRAWNFSADFTRAVRDNLAVTAGGGLTLRERTAGDDITYQARLGLDWQLGPSLAWSAGYDVSWLDAAAAGSNFVEHRVETGLTIRR